MYWIFPLIALLLGALALFFVVVPFIKAVIRWLDRH